MSSNKEYDYVYKPIIPKTVKEATDNLLAHDALYFIPHLEPNAPKEMHDKRKKYIEVKEWLLADLEIAKRHESRKDTWTETHRDEGFGTARKSHHSPPTGVQWLNRPIFDMAEFTESAQNATPPDETICEMNAV